jgi:anti-sigma-K factor RskA
MSEKELLELAPLYALGTLDGLDLEAFEKALPSNPALLAEVRSFERTLALVAFGDDPVAPSKALRDRVLEKAPRVAAPRAARSMPIFLALAAAMIVGLGLFAARLWTDRSETRDRLAASESRAAAASEINAELRRELTLVQAHAAELESVNRLLAASDTRVLSLGATPTWNGHGRAILNGAGENAALLVSGLARAPHGKVYQAWILAGGAPIPAGTFDVEDGVKLVWLKGMSPSLRIQAIAISVEPMGGVPAPTGTIVLLGKS